MCEVHTALRQQQMRVGSALEVAQDGLGQGLLVGLQVVDVVLEAVLAALVLDKVSVALAAGREAGAGSTELG